MVFGGVGRKVVSGDVGLSASTIAQILKSALADMGLDCSPARVPALLVKIAHEASGAARPSSLQLTRFSTLSGNHWALSESAECPLLGDLAPAERAVLRQLMCGRSYSDIAAGRHTSYRTVANQVASACQRLGVSGRLDLVRRVAAYPG
jgi:DNA-binding NarL/FixJ family response regulator